MAGWLLRSDPLSNALSLPQKILPTPLNSLLLNSVASELTLKLVLINFFTTIYQNLKHSFMKPNFTCYAVLGIFLFFYPAKLISQEVSYYFMAHQDDWQLFMGSSVRADISLKKVVFVTLTAGDAGLGKGGNGTIPYYNARENGSVQSTQFIANIGQTGSQLKQTTR